MNKQIGIFNRTVHLIQTASTAHMVPSVPILAVNAHHNSHLIQIPKVN